MTRLEIRRHGCLAIGYTPDISLQVLVGLMCVQLFQVRIKMRRHQSKSTCCQTCLIFAMALPHLNFLISDVGLFVAPARS